MPWTTIAVVFGSWILILIVTLVYFFTFRLNDNEPEDQA